MNPSTYYDFTDPAQHGASLTGPEYPYNPMNTAYSTPSMQTPYSSQEGPIQCTSSWTGELSQGQSRSFLQNSSEIPKITELQVNSVAQQAAERKPGLRMINDVV